MRLLALLTVLLGLAAPALAIQPKRDGELPPGTAGAPAPGAGEAGSAEDDVFDRVRARAEAQARYRAAKEARREAFLAESERFAALPEQHVAGWRDEKRRKAAIPTGDEEGSPMQLGRTLLIFSGVTGFLVLLLRFPPNRWPIWPRRAGDPASGGRRRRGSPQDGPMTIRLKPRKRRWSETGSRG